MGLVEAGIRASSGIAVQISSGVIRALSWRAQRCVARADTLARAAVKVKKLRDQRSSFTSPPSRVGRLGARRIGRAVKVARTNLTALRTICLTLPHIAATLHFRGLTLLTGASWSLNFAYLGPWWRAPYDLRAPRRTHRRVAQFARLDETSRCPRQGNDWWATQRAVPIPSGAVVGKDRGWALRVYPGHDPFAPGTLPRVMVRLIPHQGGSPGFVQRI